MECLVLSSLFATCYTHCITQITTLYASHKQVVAALPEHAHLFGEFGCFVEAGKPKRECGKAPEVRFEKDAGIETPLDPSFYPLNLTDAQDNTWYDIVKANIHPPPEKTV